MPYEEGMNVVVKTVNCNEIPDEYLPGLGQATIFLHFFISSNKIIP